MARCRAGHRPERGTRTPPPLVGPPPDPPLRTRRPLRARLSLPRRVLPAGSPAWTEPPGPRRGTPGRDRGLGRSHSVTKVRERCRDRLDVLALNRLVERRPLALKTGGLRLAQVACDGSDPGGQRRGLRSGLAPAPGERQGHCNGGALIRRRHHGHLEGLPPRSGGTRVRLSQEGGHLGVGQRGVSQGVAPAQAGETGEQEAGGYPTSGTA